MNDQTTLSGVRDRSVERQSPGARTDTVHLSVTNPDAKLIDRGDAVWVVVAMPDPGVEAAIADGADFDAVRSLLVDSPGEYSLVQASTADGLTVRAHRGITSAYDVYLTRATDGEVVVTDLFRNALASLAVDDRTVTRDVVADHLLYRTTPRGSYVAEVDRLGHGETVRWDVPDGSVERIQAERLRAPERRSRAEAVDALEAALERVTSYDPDADVVSMLSGGVDSTLFTSFLSPKTPSSSAAFDAPEFAFERQYAEDASDLLSTDHEFVTADESSFLERLEDTVDAIGMPPQQLQTPTMDLAFRGTDYEVYVNGFLCDALFGMGASRSRLVAWTRPLRHVPPVVAQLAAHRDIAEQLDRSPWNPTGLAQQFVQYLPQEYVATFVGEDVIERRQLARLQYVRQRVPLADAASSYRTHVDWGHWIEFFCENALNDYRQVAQAREKSLRAPFASAAVAEAALSVPSPDRYLQGLTNKPVPKTLLGRRVPDYDTSKPKGNGNLPIRRFLHDGPLAEALEKYDVPEFAPTSNWDQIVDEHPGMGWILLSWAIWRDRVLHEPDLTPVPSTRTVDVSR